VLAEALIGNDTSLLEAGHALWNLDVNLSVTGYITQSVLLDIFGG
jgi:hypothetical protein